MIKSIFPSFATSVLVMSMGFIPALAASDTHNHDTMNHGQMHHNQMKHGQMKHGQMKHGQLKTDDMAQLLPKEPGQGAFATIAEIVVILTSDPKTDWSKVDIDGLREHLVDMDEVSLRAKTTIAKFADKIVFTITGTGRTLQAIQAMVPAHSAVLSRTTAWNVKGELTDKGAIMTVSSNNPVTIKMITALGFYGVMATGAHHQAHHLAMAKGDNNAHAHN